jgi:hypothetical protein
LPLTIHPINNTLRVTISVEAGVAIGPFTPGFIGDLSTIQQLAELGVIFLLFDVGLEIMRETLTRLGFSESNVQDYTDAAQYALEQARGEERQGEPVNSHS